MPRPTFQRPVPVERSGPKSWENPKNCKNAAIQRDTVGYFGPEGNIPAKNNVVVKLHVTQDDGTVKQEDFDAKVLYLPLIRYRSRCKMMVNSSSSWEEGNEEKYFRPAVIPKLLYYEKFNDTERSYEDMEEFKRDLETQLRRRGIIIKSIIAKKSTENETLDDMVENCKSIEGGQGICIAIGGDEKFKRLLHACETVLGAPTFHIPFPQKQKLTKSIPLFVRKINLRMAGVNHVLTTSEEQKKANDRYFNALESTCQVNETTDVHLSFFADTMVMAFDYSTKKSNRSLDGEKEVPPLASIGFTYSTNPDGNVTGGGCFYVPDYDVPLSPQNFEEPLEQALIHFKRHMFHYPTRIIVLRNARLSRSDETTEKLAYKQQDLKIEAENFERGFRSVCKKMDDDELTWPSFLFVAISQNHKFGVSITDKPNLSPGCCIDTKINDTNLEQFLMFPNAVHCEFPFLATIVRRSGFNDHLAVIEQIILNLCYLYEVETAAVQIPAPLKCAQEMADRGIDNLNVILNSKREEFTGDYILAANDLVQPILIHRFNA